MILGCMTTLYLVSAVKLLIRLDLLFPTWRQCGVFKPAESINNPRGLCQFYQTSPGKANVLVGPKSAESARRIHRLIEIAKRLGWQLTVVVFEGESVSPWCLLSELHSHLALSRFVIHTPDKAKIGIRNHVYCCPICMHMS